MDGTTWVSRAGRAAQGMSETLVPDSSDVDSVPSQRSDSAYNVDEIISRMRHGDREAAAVFITRYGSRVRRRIRGKLGPTMRRVFDSQEILSTVGRRLDLYVRSGRLQAVGEGQLWSLIFRIADNALIDKVRVFQRLQAVESSDSDFAHELLARLQQAESTEPEGAEFEIERAFCVISDETDREILSLWLLGQPHTLIAKEVGMAATGVRKRWQSIKEQLRRHFLGGD